MRVVFVHFSNEVAFVSATEITLQFFLPFSNLPLLDSYAVESVVALELST
jgi:hypothetical protein